MKKIIFFILLAFVLDACKKDYDKIDKERIEEYLAKKGLTAQQTSSGVYYIIEKEGTGAKPTDGAEVTVKYKGYTLDDKAFDSADSIFFYLNQVIPGWQDGLKQFKVGSTGKIFIPSALAYGSDGVPGIIDGNEPLAFDITLRGIDLVHEANKKEIRDFAAKKGWKLDSLSNGLYYVIDNIGVGTSKPTQNSTVLVNYTGYFTNEKVFDSSKGTPINISLNQVIQGWRFGIPLFQEGGKGKLLIPARLGYGTGSGSIPAGKVLIFDIELIDF
jgi:FKBP-type peptidyl-prolyl cis-trans isomerase FkpA